MGATTIILWTGLGWLVLFAITFGIVFAVRPASRVDKVAATVGLPLPAELHDLASAVQRRDNNGAAISAVIGVVTAAAILITTRADSFAEILGGYVLAIMLALGFGVTVRVLRREQRRQSNSVRFARLRAITLRDYESPLRSWGARVVVALLALEFVIRVTTSPNLATADFVSMLVYVIATISTLVTAEVAKRRIIARGQPAGSSIELAWDDAIKGRAIYALGISPLFLGSYGGLLLNLYDFGIRPHGIQAAGFSIQAGLAFVGLVVNLVVAVGDAALKPQQRYRRRLWPEFNAPVGGSPAPAQPTATAAP